MKRFKKYAHLLLLPALLVLLGTSCKKSNDPYLGPTLIAASANFSAGVICPVKVSSGTDAGVCGAAGSTYYYNLGNSSQISYFHCDFNEKVTWTLTITGRNSKAVKTMSATTLGLPFGNKESLWKGEPSGFRYFMEGEICDVELSFLGSTEKRTTTVKIGAIAGAGAFNYQKVPTVSILDNFDGISAGGPITTSYVDVPDGNNKIYLERQIGAITPIDGYFMLRLKGKDANGNTYLGGTGPELLTTHADAIQTLIPLCENDPTKLYVNLYIYGTGLINSNIEVRAYEVDSLNPCKNLIVPPFGTYPVNYTADMQATNDQWYSDIYVNWTGWKLVSIPYDSFKPGRNPATGGNGNRLREPRKITSFGLLLQSMPNAGADVDVMVDFITITWGGPLNQVAF